MRPVTPYTPESSVERMIEDLQEDGYAIIEGLLNQDELATLRAQIQPHLENAAPDVGNQFMGDKTVRFGRLLHRLEMVRSKLIEHPWVMAAADAVLRPYNPTFQIHFTGVMHVTEGEKAQVLHRDISPLPNSGELTPPLVLAAMWAATDFTRENGATVFAPGSHRWPDERMPLRSELQCAEMPAGSVLLYCGNLIHGAGACKKGFRTGVALQYCVGWMRQEENQYLAVPLEEARTFPESLQRLMGYDLASRHWGYVDQQHPMNFLNQTDRFGGLDPQGYELPGRAVALHAVPSGLHIEHRYPVTLDDEQ